MNEAFSSCFGHCVGRGVELAGAAAAGHTELLESKFETV
jgi:hypothetical protein